MRGIIYKKREIPSDPVNPDRQKKDRRRNGNGKLRRCSVCGNATFQKDGICVVCMTHVSGMYTELQALLAVDRRRGIKHFRKHFLSRN